MQSRILMSALLCVLCMSPIFAQAERGGAPGGRPSGGREMETSDRKPPAIGLADESERYLTISAGGRLQPKIRIDHQASASGFVREVYVVQAQRVEIGQALFSIERDSAAGSFKPAVVTSRIAGVVSDIAVQPLDEIAVGRLGVTVIGAGGYVLEATISDKDAFKVNVGDTITGHTADGATLRGRLTGRSVEPDYNTGLFFVTFEFPPDQPTHIGEFVMVDLPVDRTVGIFVSRELLVRRYGRFFLWVVSGEDLLEIRQVETGAVIGDEILVTAGLTAGERYLMFLTGREKEGDPVVIPE